jgi:menaquinone-9 beta-reductase
VSAAPLIIGAGPAGASAAILLAQGGMTPQIVERARETGDALCGGFLSWRTLARLGTLGVSADDLGGHPVDHVRLYARKRMASAPLPGGAMGVSRHRLDTLLIARAVAAGAKLERGVTVKRIESGAVQTSDGATLSAPQIIAATGKHDVSGLGRTREDDPALGLRVRLAAHPELTRLVGSAIELHLFDGGYAGLMLQESGDANLCLAVRKSRFARANSDPASLLAQIGRDVPALAERLAFMETPRADAIGAVPYGWIARESLPGVLRIGDQAGCIPSLAGEGNGIAIGSGIAAAEALLSANPATISWFQPMLGRAITPPIGMAKAIWRLCETRVGAAAAVHAVNWLPGLAGMMARATRFRG